MGAFGALSGPQRVSCASWGNCVAEQGDRNSVGSAEGFYWFTKRLGKGITRARSLYPFTHLFVPRMAGAQDPRDPLITSVCLQPSPRTHTCTHAHTHTHMHTDTHTHPHTHAVPNLLPAILLARPWALDKVIIPFI